MGWSRRALVLILVLAALVPGSAADRAEARPAAGQEAPGQGNARQPTPGRRVLGYYVPYDPTSWATLEAHADALDDVAAQWVTIDA